VKEMDKIGKIRNSMESSTIVAIPGDDLKLFLLRAELNRELFEFWNSIDKE
jgi:hypothetical protein